MKNHSQKRSMRTIFIALGVCSSIFLTSCAVLDSVRVVNQVVDRVVGQVDLVEFGLLTISLPVEEVAPFKPIFNSNQNFDLQEKTKTITWIKTDKRDELNRACISAGVSHGALSMMGCSIWTKNECKIITHTRTSLSIIGHELRHCFMGNFH